MRKDLTELVFILDRSGSMAGLESDTIGGYNALLKKQQEEVGEAVVTTVLFDDKYELLHDRINIKGIRPITEKEYYVRGCTALLDAFGKTIQKIVNVQRNTAEDQRAEKVMFVITTDGLENASQEYSYPAVKKMVEEQKNTYGWEFIFIGANIDAVAEAAKVGISANKAANYRADRKGTMLNYKTVSNAVSGMRINREVPNDWKDEIDKDYAGRENKKQQ